MYFDDLSIRPQRTRKHLVDLADIYPRSYMVGWIDESHPYSRGNISPQLLERLFLHGCRPVMRIRAYRYCPLCDVFQPHVSMTIDEVTRTIILGSAEVFVQGADGATYFAPDLILHYVIDHDYCPPNKFLDALMTSRPNLGWEVERECYIEIFGAESGKWFDDNKRTVLEAQLKPDTPWFSDDPKQQELYTTIFGHPPSQRND